MTPFHPLHTAIEKPERLNDPFDYEPHPLCILAAREVRRYTEGQPQWAEELAAGKMLGVLVCETAGGELGFLAAYSGQIGGRADWPWFVPAVLDYLKPDGHFRQEERNISLLNRRIAMMEADSGYRQRLHAVETVKQEAEKETAAFREEMKKKRELRLQRRTAGALSEAEEAALIRESQYMKAELRRLKARWRTAQSEAEAALHPISEAVEALRRERRQRSDQLQRWLFDQTRVADSSGQLRSMTDIFLHTTQGVPPSGAGECCAPKLLHYAFTHHLKPLALAEFWHGRSPRMEVRHDAQFYPACRGKCKPILEWMLKDMKPISPVASIGLIRPIGHIGPISQIGLIRPIGHIRPISQIGLIRPIGHIGPISPTNPAHFLVISKPSGLLSVPGKSDSPSVESIVRERYGQVFMVHRLDMDTSGLMVVALNAEAYHHLQRQFLQRTVVKRYVALLDGVLTDRPQVGTISLPLRPDVDDRPRQVVDDVHGRPAITDYRVLAIRQGRTLIELTPHTGRTHQLRMHCAHERGLGLPIVGDRLYGRPAERLCLHAFHLSFTHPATGERLTFSDDEAHWPF